MLLGLLLLLLAIVVGGALASQDSSTHHNQHSDHNHDDKHHKDQHDFNIEFDGWGPEKVSNWAGYITVNTTRHLWYWFFESRSDPVNDPFLLWMTGGPGCSSLVALFYENGPYHVYSNLSVSLNPYSWNSIANVLWIDQPVGTGFSYADSGDLGVVTEEQMANNMYEFLQKFMTAYPKYQNLSFYITGESYAGHYVPALASRVMQGNSAREGVTLNLMGIGIGNGLVDPPNQYTVYPAYAKDHNLVTAAQYGLMNSVDPVCIGLIKGCVENSTLGWLACINAYTVCNYAEILPVQFTGVNIYDVRSQCTVPPLCYDFSALDTLLTQPDLLKALGVNGRKWTSCNQVVELKLVFAGDWMLNFAQDIPLLLANNVSVLVYHGEWDFIVNWYGGSVWTAALPWPHQQDFNNAPNTTWHVNGVEAGSSISADLLTFLRVKDAGHMVPMDQSAAALDMLSRLFTRRPFN